MKSYIILGFLILALAGSIYISRKDFKNWKVLEPRDMYYAIRVPFIAIIGIILLVLKILKNH